MGANQYNFEDLIGQILIKIDVRDDVIYFHTQDSEYKMFHDQSCCESVYVEDICGNIENLLNLPIIIAEERTNSDIPLNPEDNYPDGSFTWTFYELATVNGSVTIRWYGSSNGYYSESVDFVKIYGE